MTVYIFNPDTDYALGCVGGNYNPPSSVLRLRRQMALFPATYASHGDLIMTVDDIAAENLCESVYYGQTLQKEIKIASPKEISNLLTGRCGLNNCDDVEIVPWGWNMSLRNLLLKNGVPTTLVKSAEEIDQIRSLSHRRTTIPFHSALAEFLPNLNLRCPTEFHDVEEALRFAAENTTAYFKMPWSSSGRGIICCRNMSNRKLMEWIHGAIARQGSVLGEYGYDRAADFASEWWCKSGEVGFAGLSWFCTSSNGRYMANEKLSQAEIENKIKSFTSLWSRDIIEAQKVAIQKLIAPHYDGPLGIDMLADRNGDICPCVEINIRMTMGMATILEN